MIYRGQIEAVKDNVAWGTLYTEENEKRFISIPLPENIGFNIKTGVDVTLFDGDEAKHDDNSITPVIIMTRRNKALILQMKEEDQSLIVISGTIIDKETLDNYL